MMSAKPARHASLLAGHGAVPWSAPLLPVPRRIRDAAQVPHRIFMSSVPEPQATEKRKENKTDESGFIFTNGDAGRPKA
ncbi:hypothetical protein [Solimonas fluminis]|uniref:hypothetical protein n=1 Tax=Solimonas fluminis TaxID=2086571 RepID=UPI0010575304|nr:hypothetical protein [Solimonas fluminis]